MDWLQASIIALIQGVTEFLPISSSAHLLFPSLLFGWPDQGLAFDVAVHLGSLLAVMFYLRQDILRMIQGSLQWLFGRGWNADAHLAMLLVLATIPAVVFGLAFNLVSIWDPFCRNFCRKIYYTINIRQKTCNFKKLNESY